MHCRVESICTQKLDLPAVQYQLWKPGCSACDRHCYWLLLMRFDKSVSNLIALKVKMIISNAMHALLADTVWRPLPLFYAGLILMIPMIPITGNSGTPTFGRVSKSLYIFWPSSCMLCALPRKHRSNNWQLYPDVEKGVDPGNLVPRRNQRWQKEFGQVYRTCGDFHWYDEIISVNKS